MGDDGRSVIPGAVSERLDFPGFRECTGQNNNPPHLVNDLLREKNDCHKSCMILRLDFDV